MIHCFAADEDFNHRILRGLQKILPGLRITTVQGANREGKPDPEQLAWAARERCVLLSHDVNTMVRSARERMRRGEPMSGLIIVPQELAIGDAVRDLEVIALCTDAEEWHGKVEYLPL